MRVLVVRNVHEALPVGMDLMKEIGLWEKSRNGRVIVAPVPVTTVYERPRERVLFHRWRNANPFFHLYEGLWMLAGRQDVAPLARFVTRITEFSDDGKSFNAAYGHRWRRHHVLDQLNAIVELITKSRHTRRAVLQIWDAGADLFTREALVDPIPYNGKDAACNLMATFQVRHGALNMAVFCRSNDIIWGAYGANAVHFSMLQEYVASRLVLPVGKFTQISVNWHAYEDIWTRLCGRRKQAEWAATTSKCEDHLIHGAHRTIPYDLSDFEPYPLMSTHHSDWDQDCARFVTKDGTAPSEDFNDPFFTEVALPIVRAHDEFRAGNLQNALATVSTCVALDWQLACAEWLSRRRPR